MSDDLEIAVALTTKGIPIFTAEPNKRFDPTVTDYKDPRSKEFWLPTSWQKTDLKLSAVHLQRHKPGWAACLVCGVMLDGIDVDAKHGADVEAQRAAVRAAGIVIVGEARSASGGAHFYVMSTGIASSAKPVNGVDFRGGLVDGASRGFLFIPGTTRSPLRYPYGGTYAWVQEIDLTLLDGVDRADQQGRILGYLRSVGMNPKYDTAAGPARDQAQADHPTNSDTATAAVPSWLQTLVDDIGPTWTTAAGATSTDRSERFYAIVGACRKTGLTKGQTIALVTPWCEAVDKYVGRVADEVERIWPKVDPPTPATTADPDRWIDKKDGLLVAALADDIARDHPLMHDPGDQVWVYVGGVWRPDEHGWVRRSVAGRLGNKTRPAHTAAVVHYILGVSDLMLCQPVPEYVNVKNGLLDWRTGRLEPHRPDVLSTVQLDVAWDPDATCPAIDAWLADVLPADLLEPTDDGPGFIWEVIGYLCFSGNPLHKAILLLGSGRNGKGTFLRLVTRLLGMANVSSVDLHSLVTNRFRAAELFGKVANIAGDLDGSWLESTALFKAITGDDPIQAERKYGAPFDYKPFAVPVYSANKVFGTPDSTDGYLSRWVVIPFPNSFLGREDRTLDTRLQTPDEIAGMFTKAIAGLRAVMARNNFTNPASTAEAYQRFADESDPIRGFLAETTRKAEGEFVIRDKVWEIYKLWTEESGIRKALSRTKLYAGLENAGWRAIKRKGARGFADRALTVQIAEDSQYEKHLEPLFDGLPDNDTDNGGQRGADKAGTATPGPVYGGKGREPAPSAPQPLEPAPRAPSVAAETPPKPKIACFRCGEPMKIARYVDGALVCKACQSGQAEEQEWMAEAARALGVDHV